MNAPRQPSDQSERDRIESDLDSTLFVDAGAGSGKTKALVDRVVALVLSGVAMENIAAITFTEKAAAELRSRIRTSLEDLRAGDSPANRTIAEVALRQLDGAAISTLHAFAKRLLSEHPVEAGLPPDVEVLDDIGSKIEFDTYWREFLEVFLEEDEMAPTLLRLEALDVKLATIRDLAAMLNEEWDRLEGRFADAQSPLPRVEVGGIQAELRVLTGLKSNCSAGSTDGLFARVEAVENELRRLDTAHDDILRMEIIRAAMEASSGQSRGKGANWGDKQTGPANKAAALDALNQLARPRNGPNDPPSACQAALEEAGRQALHSLLARLTRFILNAAEERRVKGRLEFHDLLVRACKLLRSPQHGTAVRRSLRDRYRKLLLDEFQDTDPLQIELAVLLACPPGTDSGGLAWSDMHGEAGRLFFVGDPKQSIYRFRRADIATFLRARSWVSADTFGATASLNTNFRSVSPIIDWVNEVFAMLIVEAPGSQPDYIPLASWRQAGPVGPSVAVLGATELEPNDERASNAETLRVAEAQALSAAIADALKQRWAVGDNEGGWQPIHRRDIAVLIPTRTSLPALEAALDAESIPYRLETSSLVYSTREVRDLLMALQAVADPSDELSLVAALRTSLYGCGDDDLAHWRLACRGRFSLIGSLPEDAPIDHPVVESIRHLKDLSRAARWADPPTLLNRLVRERGAFETAIVAKRPRDVWRHLRFVIDQAWAWADAGGTGLRNYIDWARLQGREDARVNETVLPESDDDSVKIFTVHGAKGLEFPMAVLSGMTAVLSRPPRSPVVAFDGDGTPVIRLRARVAETESYRAWSRIDRQMDEDERRRLLYVACTRARDHLVVSLFRVKNSRTITGASVLAQAGAGDFEGAVHLDEQSTPDDIPASMRAESQHAKAATSEPWPNQVDQRQDAVADSPPLPDRSEWLDELERRLGSASRSIAVSPTSLARDALMATGAQSRYQDAEATDPISDQARDLPSDPGLAKDGDDSERAPWSKGRSGTAVGRAVHGVLQDVDLSDGHDLEALARHHAAAEAIGYRGAEVVQLARSALGTKVAMQAATAQRCWREMFVAAPFGERLVEGYVDLVYRSPDGLVVVDWKTDTVAGDDDVDAKLARYRLQGAAYAAALEAVTGEPVARMVFVFLGRDGAIERELPDLRGAVEEAKAAVAGISG